MSALGAWRRWQAAAGPWRGYAICPALQVGATRAEPPKDAHPPIPSWKGVFAPEPTAVVVDLNPSVGVTWAAYVSRERLAHVVLVLPRWPHADAVLPCDELVAALTATSGWLKDANAPSVVFVLDAERRKTIARRWKKDERVDNRYDVTAGDLPNLRTLRAAGIERVVKISQG